MRMFLFRMQCLPKDRRPHAAPLSVVGSALLSDSQDILLQELGLARLGQAQLSGFDGRASIDMIERLRVPLWLRSDHHLVQLVESAASHEYQAGDRDPMSCLLLYAALGGARIQVLARLFAIDSQKVMAAMLTTIARRDKEGDSARRTALDTAHLLMSRHAHMRAAGFFLLGGDPATAVRVLYRTAGLPMMALIVARLSRTHAEGGADRTVGGREWGSLRATVEKSNPI